MHIIAAIKTEPYGLLLIASTSKVKQRSWTQNISSIFDLQPKQLFNFNVLHWLPDLIGSLSSITSSMCNFVCVNCCQMVFVFIFYDRLMSPRIALYCNR